MRDLRGLFQDDPVLPLLERLRSAGFEAYIVGGALRDALLGRPVNDVDLATSALPTQIVALFEELPCLEVGAAFGTVKVFWQTQWYEITTFRSEGRYTGHRRPQQVQFESDIEEDLQRRDFTINAMAWSPQSGLLDPYQGQRDLKARCIRAVQDPWMRFEEDALRMLRAVRFAAQLNFVLERATLAAISGRAPLIQSISQERVQDELSKLMLSEKPSVGLKVLEKSGLLAEVLPELLPSVGFDQHNPWHSMDVWNHTLCVVDHSPPRLAVRLAALFHDVAKPLCYHTLPGDPAGHFYGHDVQGANIARQALIRLKYPKEILSLVPRLVERHMIQAQSIGKKGIKHLLQIFGQEAILDIVDLYQADCACTVLGENPFNFREKVEQVIEAKEPFSVKDLAIGGNALMDLGLKGPQIGHMLQVLLEKVLEEPSLNEESALLEIARTFFESQEPL